jgi:PKD repeat protein
MGGVDNRIGLKNDTWRSTDKGATWTEMNASCGWTNRYGHSSVVLPDGSIVLMGGGDTRGYRNDTWRSTDKGATWAQINASSGWMARIDHSSVVLADGSIVLISGDTSVGLQNDVWRSTDSGETWMRETANPGWAARWGHSSVVTPDGSIILMGGHDPGNYVNDVWRQIPASPTTLTADFIGTPISGTAPHSVQFNDTSSGLPARWNWSFGDGLWFNTTNAAVSDPIHVYRKPGTFTVSLTVANNSEKYTRTRLEYITIFPAEGYLTIQPPTKSIEAGSITNYTILLENAPQGLAGYNLTVALSNTSIGEIRRVFYPSWGNMSTNSSLPADQAWFRAVDLANKSGTRNITLCIISVQGNTPGITGVSVTPGRIEDRAGGWYNVTGITAELSVASLEGRFPKPGGGRFPAATDIDGDGKYEDLDGNDWVGFNDVVLAYNNLDAIDAGAYGPRELFDYDGNGWFGFNDIVVLFGMT